MECGGRNTPTAAVRVNHLIWTIIVIRIWTLNWLRSICEHACCQRSCSWRPASNASTTPVSPVIFFMWGRIIVYENDPAYKGLDWGELHHNNGREGAQSIKDIKEGRQQPQQALLSWDSKWNGSNWVTPTPNPLVDYDNATHCNDVEVWAKLTRHMEPLLNPLHLFRKIHKAKNPWGVLENGGTEVENYLGWGRVGFLSPLSRPASNSKRLSTG